MAKKKEEQEPKIVRYFDVNDLEKLLREIDDFMYSMEEMTCDRRDIFVNIYDNGKVELEGEFSITEKKEIII